MVEQLGRAVQVALAERRAEPELAVGVQVPRREADQPRRLDHEQVGLRAGVELEPVGRAARDDDVVERLERQRAEEREQLAAAPVDEEDLVGERVAVQLRLRLGRAGSARASRRRWSSSGTRPVIGSPSAGISPVLR